MNGHMIQKQNLLTQQVDKLQAENEALHSKLLAAESKLTLVYQFCENGRDEAARIAHEQPETKQQAEAVSGLFLKIEQFIDQLDTETVEPEESAE